MFDGQRSELERIARRGLLDADGVAHDAIARRWFVAERNGATTQRSFTYARNLKMPLTGIDEGHLCSLQWSGDEEIPPTWGI